MWPRRGRIGRRSDQSMQALDEVSGTLTFFEWHRAVNASARARDASRYESKKCKALITGSTVQHFPAAAPSLKAYQFKILRHLAERFGGVCTFHTVRCFPLVSRAVLDILGR